MDAAQIYFALCHVTDTGRLSGSRSERAFEALHIHQTEGNLAALGLAKSILMDALDGQWVGQAALEGRL